jgi:predicted nuclease of restriction endonuclease-like (RecB) superfamily
MNKPEINIEKYSGELFERIAGIIKSAQKKVAVFLNAETTLLYWSVGDYINSDLKSSGRTSYGSEILATLSQQLTLNFGKGYTYTALTRMCKVAANFDQANIATLSQQLSWSHLIELAAIEDATKQDFYTQLCVYEKWSVRELRKKTDEMLFERTAISARPEETIQNSLKKLKDNRELNPELVFKNSYILNFLNLPAHYSEKELEDALIENLEKFILELGNGFAFIERQKRIPVDSTDYHLDLLFYHRKLRRLVAIDLKLGKFKPKYKAQMELYLKWLKKHEMQTGEETPVGLLLCSEGNTEHIEFLMLDEKNIKVAQYLTQLPSKKWFADKLHRAMEIVKTNTQTHE